ncbi:alpha/beta hydrolase [Pseudalgibacter alginicilyticus]|uniref:Alpha/beta hydrolase n=1 Tax=Pseudalgibacter alginicilyticus TaxID=1736674 RepID=A0A0P0DCH4_9FLAO|nr:alpha/beta hydrolase [Pseudalgibacter alginicilyticus]ALJ05685.1 alpha/beta hydrolase [Pseudalgibacter alginicilyticus]
MIISKNIIIEGSHSKPILTDIFYTKNNKPKPIIIFCHGYKGFKDWGAWNLMAAAFANAGFFFIKFNFSHNGGTSNQPIDFPDLEAFGNNNYTKELDDLKVVIDWICSNDDLKKEADTKTLSLIGHSRGGGIVAIKAEEDSRIKKLITLASVSDYANRMGSLTNITSWQKKGVKFVVNGRTKQQMPHYYQFYEDFIKNKNRLTIERAVSNLKIPHLILHGSEDTSVSIKEANNLHKWNPKSKFKVIEGANHVFGASHPWKKKTLPEHLKDTINTIITFLNN